MYAFHNRHHLHGSPPYLSSTFAVTEQSLNRAAAADLNPVVICENGCNDHATSLRQPPHPPRKRQITLCQWFFLMLQVLSAQLGTAGLVGASSFGRLLEQKATAASTASTTSTTASATSTASDSGAANLGVDTAAAAGLAQQSVSHGAQDDLFSFLRSGDGAFPGSG